MDPERSGLPFLRRLSLLRPFAAPTIASLGGLGGARVASLARHLVGVCWRTPCWRTPIHRLERSNDDSSTESTLTALAVVGVMAIPVRGDDDRGRRAFRAEVGGTRSPRRGECGQGQLPGALERGRDLGSISTLDYEGFEGTVTQAPHPHRAAVRVRRYLGMAVQNGGGDRAPDGACRHADVRNAWRGRAKEAEGGHFRQRT